jgi:hypothetical protein
MDLFGLKKSGDFPVAKGHGYPQFYIEPCKMQKWCQKNNLKMCWIEFVEGDLMSPIRHQRLPKPTVGRSLFFEDFLTSGIGGS